MPLAREHAPKRRDSPHRPKPRAHGDILHGSSAALKRHGGSDECREHEAPEGAVKNATSC
jgi:hypothetical protein